MTCYNYTANVDTKIQPAATPQPGTDLTASTKWELHRPFDLSVMIIFMRQIYSSF